MSYVPTQKEAREWAARRIATEQWDWDTIAEGAHPDGIVLDQEGCDVVAEALYSCAVTVTWSDGESVTYPPELR